MITVLPAQFHYEENTVSDLASVIIATVKLVTYYLNLYDFRARISKIENGYVTIILIHKIMYPTLTHYLLN